MRFRVLGPLQVWRGAGWSTIRAPQQRVVLAVLLTEAGRVVSVDRLVDEIWGDRPPRTALNTIQGYVVRLRRLLGNDPDIRLLTRGRGYQLEASDTAVDARVFEQLLDSGQRSLCTGRLDAAVGQLAEGLALWRGPALADVSATPAVVAEAARLEQRRLTALETRLGAELELGRHADAVDELQRLVGEYPLRERLRGQLMIALYRCGRRAEALETYRRGREVLVAELGMEPGPELRELERAILADAVPRARAADAAAPAAGRVTPMQVPADVPGFTGRAEHLRRLDTLLSGGATPVLRMITGTAGVGKTALVVHWAHRVGDRFPDGQLFVNLRGHASGPPVRPIDALARFLHALGVPAEQVPVDLEEGAALYRSLLSGRRMLVVLDNAHHPDQVRPLLPAAPGCVVLITSRSVLTGLVARDGVDNLTLDVLAPDETRILLTRLLGTARVRAQARAAGQLAGLCAHLPLAIRIAAANILTHPRHTIATYTRLLRAGNRLAALQVTGDDQAAVRAAFDLSYSALPADVRRAFRLVGLAPGPDVTAEAVGALTGDPPEDAARLLDLLAAAHLIDRADGGRYGCHDLLRLYANERGGQEDAAADRAAATARLYDWYLRRADAAAAILYPQMCRLTQEAAPEPDVFADHATALAWLDAERPNLVAALVHAAGHEPRPVVGMLAEALRGYFWLRMYTVDWMAVARAGLTAAEALDDPRAMAAAWLSLADAHYRLGLYRQAVVYSTNALAVTVRVGWADGQAAALGNLGNLHMELGELPEAAESHRRALELNRRAGRLSRQANNLGNLGVLYWQMGELRTALTHTTEALHLNRKLGSRHGEALSLGNLGGIWRVLGRLDAALDQLCAALPLHLEVGDRGAETDTRADLAAVHCDAGRYTEALEQAHTALAMAHDLAYRSAETEIRNTLGTIHQRMGHGDIAADHHRQALELARSITHRSAETAALAGLAVATRDPGPAEAALELAGRSGYRVLEGRSLTALAAVHLAADRPDRAADLAERALACHRRTGYRLGEAQTLLVLGGALDRAGHPDRARIQHRAARALLDEIGAPWPDHVPVMG